tara:strand:+ start:618 stop:1211 length:594 start_codon:yes stop_codon:yes gene_type:complete
MGVISNGTTLLDAGALDSGVATGAMTLLSTATASSSSTLSFTSGISSTYSSYVFKFINIHPSANSMFGFQTSTNGGSSYGVTATTSFFRAQQHEGGGSETLAYDTSMDLAQSTSNIRLGRPIETDADESLSGTLTIFSPSSGTFVKHYAYNNSVMGNYIQNAFGGGYFNTTSAINAVKFEFESGNIDSGIIKMYGMK